MKHVFSNAWDVIHLWAQQTQQEAHSSDVNFDGTTLYSYGSWWIGHFVRPGVVLLRDARYSHTTSRHQGCARQASIQHRQFYVAEIFDDNSPYTKDAHTKNITNYLYHLDDDEYIKFTCSRLARNKKWAYAGWTRWRTELRAYCRLFGQKMPKYKSITDKQFDAIYNKAIAREKQLESGRDDRQRKAQEYRDKVKAKLIESKTAEFAQIQADWLAGQTDQTSLHIAGKRWRSNFVEMTFPEIRLRANADKSEIETSNHARIPYKAGQMLFNRWRLAPEKLIGNHAGRFEIVESDTEHLRAGCTTISAQEINRFAKQENWT